MSNFSPCYNFKKDPLILNKALNVKFLLNERINEGKVKIIFSHKRKFSVKFDISINSSKDDSFFGLFLLAHSSKVKEIQIKEVNIPAFCVQSGGEKNRLVFTPKQSNFDIHTTISIHEKKISYVIGHLFNFNYFFENIINFIYDDWQIEISQSSQLSENDLRNCKREEIQINTHTIKISTVSSNEFSIREVNELIKGLNLFLSFYIGDWRSIVLPVGFDHDKKVIWQPYSYFRNSKKFPTYNWSLAYKDSLLCTLAPLFLRKYYDEQKWQKALHESIFWFISSNDLDRGMESGVILAQSALELLAFIYIVQDKKLLEKESFKKLTTSDKLRLFLRSLDIPIDIEESHKKLKDKIGNHNKWADLAHAITDIRNSFIHPEHSSKGNFYVLAFEAWKINLRLLELSILAICKYDGEYSNRETVTTHGQLEPVPWSQFN